MAIKEDIEWGTVLYMHIKLKNEKHDLGVSLKHYTNNTQLIINMIIVYII